MLPICCFWSSDQILLGRYFYLHLQSALGHFPLSFTVWPWASYLIPWSFSCIICKLELIISISQVALKIKCEDVYTALRPLPIPMTAIMSMIACSIAEGIAAINLWSEIWAAELWEKWVSTGSVVGKLLPLPAAQQQVGLNRQETRQQVKRLLCLSWELSQTGSCQRW